MSRQRPVPLHAPPDTGAYLLLITVQAARTLCIGRLGRVPFRRGNYVYIGSGMGGLQARIARHFRPDKKIKWHIDRLLGVAKLQGAVLFPSERRNECDLARSCLSFPGADVVPGFGSSDCRCPGHLVFLGARPFGALLGCLDDRVQGPGSRVQGRTRVQGPGSRATIGRGASLYPVPCTLVGEALH